MTELHLVHFQTSSSTVRCGAPMAAYAGAVVGWTLGDVTVDPMKITCPNCKPVVRDPESWQAVAREGRRHA